MEGGWKELPKNTHCRICLQISLDDIPLEGFISYKLRFVIPIIDLEISLDPTICRKCYTNLLTQYKFKSICLENNEPAHNFMELEMLTSKSDFQSMHVNSEEKRRKCGLCRSKNNVVALLTGTHEKLFRIMLVRCLPDLDIIVPIVCKNCLESLKSLFRFVNVWLETEAKIKGYCNYLKNLGSHQGKINLQDMLEFTLNLGKNGKKEKKQTMGKEDEHVVIEEETDPIQNSRDGSVTSKPIFDDVVVIENCVDIEMDIKSEPEIDIEEGPHRGYIEGYAEKLKEGTDKKPTVKRFNKPCRKEKPNTDPVFDRLLQQEKSCGQISNEQKETNNETSSKTETKSNTKTKGKTLSTLQAKQGVRMFHCPSCPFKSTKEIIFNRHVMTTHKNLEKKLYRKSRKKRNKSLIMHTRLQECKEYECAQCLFRTNTEALIVNHVKAHKSVHEAYTQIQGCDKSFNFKCRQCPFVAKLKQNVIKHVWSHVDLSDVIIYACKLCSFETKHKETFIEHGSVHKNTIFRCGLCSYRTKHRSIEALDA